MPGPQPPQVISVFSSTITLTDAQIKALPTTQVEIIPSPGAGKGIVIIAGSVSPNFSVAYNISSGSSWQLMAGITNVSGVIEADIILNLSSTLPRTFGSLSVQAGSGTFAGVNVGTQFIIENSGISIQDFWNGVPDYTGGDPANTMDVTVLYAIIDV